MVDIIEIKREKWVSGYVFTARVKGRIVSWKKVKGNKDAKKQVQDKARSNIRKQPKVDRVGQDTFQLTTKDQQLRSSWVNQGYTGAGECKVIDLRSGKALKGTYFGMTRVKTSRVSKSELIEEIEENALRNAMLKTGNGIRGGSDPPEYYQAKLVSKIKYNTWVNSTRKSQLVY